MTDSVGGLVPNLSKYQSRTIVALAQEQGKDPVDTLCQDLVDDKDATRELVRSISPRMTLPTSCARPRRSSAPTVIASRPPAPADFRDRATYEHPHQYPTGARTSVIVNGTLVVENATHTGALPGKVLRRDREGRVG